VVRQRHQGVDAEAQKPTHLAAVDFAEQLVDIHARPRQFIGGNAPNSGDVGAVLVILDVAAAGQLVALLAMLAPALAVALSRDGRVAAAFAADPARRQYEVDGAQDVLHAVAVVLDAAGVHQETGLRRTPPFRRQPDRPLGDTRDLRGALRRPLLDVL